jgi:hypothetical protein
MLVVAITETEAAEARLVDLAERSKVDRRTTCRALKISQRTYYRRRALAERLKAQRDRED